MEKSRFVDKKNTFAIAYDVGTRCCILYYRAQYRLEQDDRQKSTQITLVHFSINSAHRVNVSSDVPDMPGDVRVRQVDLCCSIRVYMKHISENVPRQQYDSHT